MRVTNKMLSNNFLRDMRTNLNNIQTLQGQLSSGKEIRRPSDNPFKVARSMQLHSDITENKQYNENIKDTLNNLDATDTSLGQATSVFQRMRELLVSAGNAAYGSDERKAIKDEFNQKVEELTQVLNTNFDGSYIFGGTKSTSKPLKVDYENGNSVIKYSGKEGNDATPEEINMMKAKMKVEISQGVTMEYNVTSNEIFEFKDDKGKVVDVTKMLSDIVKNFDSDTPDAKSKLVGENLKDITSTMSNLLKVRAEVGAKQNRMEAAQSKNEDENFNMTDILSKTEDIDITQKIMEYSTMQTVYTASLQTSAKVIQPTLMDYLR
ncbi:flagellar hook-associated protein 3 FlgL [Clostridium cavendishii DSM 21758]|uniref:Flagellar hook-associated protein 3 FlgL n=1 Tax=Clostridium cavendishii DSM 21758 TaxID=1121302 RepID=A0A1M6B468_9CLOT|nr:flagellar hook-associated protein FlgL [Clostridium cavendishii]SHI43457.1 flagellar hook-associated protein 3 FlgL [Clostridium cavendishii DSM 21758]